MNKNIRERWTEALKSGRYQQTTGQLAGGTQGVPRFCCLGVLCDLHSAETGEQWNGDTYFLENHTLPTTVLKWAGLPPDHHTVEINLKVDNGTTTLACLNDDGHSFDIIANIIDEEL